MLYPIDEILLALMIFSIMFGMGASLTIDDFKTVMRYPRGILIGFLSQFGLMPFFAYSLALFLNLDPAFAIAIILIGCLPGGTTSNMFAYFARGSVALSIAMTTASTTVAILMMPILLEFYTTDFTAVISAQMQAEGAAAEFVIPTFNIVASLILVLVPVILGMILRAKSPLWAKTAEDTAGFMGIIVIIFLIGTVFIRQTQLLLATPATIYLAAISVGLLGFLFGFWMSRLFRLPPIFQRAISLETGIQNGPIAFAIILLSFSEPYQSQMLWLAILYSTFIVISSSFITLFYRKVGKFDYEVYKNTTIHNKLFGESYKTNYPEGYLPPRIQGDPSQGSYPAQKREK
ncbi:MAG: transporter [Balneolaceae bacterium]|nr:MAG: transporter [Balneolaceae bacterium]